METWAHLQTLVSQIWLKSDKLQSGAAIIHRAAGHITKVQTGAYSAAAGETII
jgi:hypothetical protein